MRFSSLLTRLSEVVDSTPRHLAADPELSGAEALDRAAAGQLSFLEPGNALAAALAATGAVPCCSRPTSELQQQASERGIAWVALKDPRLAFAEALEALYPRRPKPPAGAHPSAVVDPSVQLGSGPHRAPW